MPEPRRLCAALGLALVLLGVTAVGAGAAGSQNLWPNGAAGNRANSEWRISSYGGGLIMRRTLVKAFMNAGEVVDVGSSAIGQGSADILVWNPGLITGPIGNENVSAAPSFSCNGQRSGAQGQITSRAQELTGHHPGRRRGGRICPVPLRRAVDGHLQHRVPWSRRLRPLAGR